MQTVRCNQTALSFLLSPEAKTPSRATMCFEQFFPTAQVRFQHTERSFTLDTEAVHTQRLLYRPRELRYRGPYRITFRCARASRSHWIPGDHNLSPALSPAVTRSPKPRSISRICRCGGSIAEWSIACQLFGGASARALFPRLRCGAGPLFWRPGLGQKTAFESVLSRLSPGFLSLRLSPLAIFETGGLTN